MLDSEATRQDCRERVEAGLPSETSGPPVAPEVMFNSLVEAATTSCASRSRVRTASLTTARGRQPWLPGRVEVVDGRSISLGYGLQVLEVARLAATGATREAVAAAVFDIQQRIMIRFFLETLEQVKRGGRLDALMPVLGRLGQALNIRGMLTVNNEGRISLVGPARVSSWGDQTAGAGRVDNSPG